jgi:hypothetical protein
MVRRKQQLVKNKIIYGANTKPTILLLNRGSIYKLPLRCDHASTGQLNDTGSLCLEQCYATQSSQSDLNTAKEGMSNSTSVSIVVTETKTR